MQKQKEGRNGFTNRINHTTKLKWPVKKKVTMLIIGATLFSLIMGAPISYIKHLLLGSGVLGFLGEGINTVLETYFTIIINLVIMIVFIMFGLKRYVEKPINQMVQDIAEIQGDEIDLSRKVSINTHDEFAVLASSFNGMLSNLNQVIELVNDVSNHMTDASKEVASSSEQVSASGKGIADSIQQLAEKAEGGDAVIANVSEKLAGLSSLTQVAQSKAGIANDHSEITRESAEEGKETVIDVIGKMGNIKESTEETKQLIVTLDEYSKEITNITEMITNIAEQTNLLALNAAIEAARAGEAGKGFAVVAGEVRNLAERSTKGAEDVSHLIRKITETTSKTVQATTNSQNEVETGVVAVRKAGDALENIVQAVNETEKAVTEIVEITREEVETSENMVGLIDTLAAFIEDTGSSTEEVSASTQQTSASMETIVDSSEGLNQLSADLKHSLERFKTTEE